MPCRLLALTQAQSRSIQRSITCWQWFVQSQPRPLPIAASDEPRHIWLFSHVLLYMQPQILYANWQVKVPTVIGGHSSSEIVRYFLSRSTILHQCCCFYGNRAGGSWRESNFPHTISGKMNDNSPYQKSLIIDLSWWSYSRISHGSGETRDIYFIHTTESELIIVSKQSVHRWLVINWASTLSTQPVVTCSARRHNRNLTSTLLVRCVNNLAKVIIWKWTGRELNPWSINIQSDA